MNASSTPPTHTISLHRQIYCFKISDFEGSANVFCAALENKVVLGLLHFPVSFEGITSIDVDETGGVVNNFSWHCIL